MATRIGIMAEIGLDGRGFNAGLLAAEKRLSRFASGIGTKLAGMFSIGALLNFARHVDDWIGKLHDFAESTGIGAEAVQTMNIAAKQTGVTLEQVTAMLKALSTARDTALGEFSGEGKLGIFERLGFDKSALFSLSNQYEALKQIGGAVAKLPPGMDRTRIATELFGRSGLKSIAFLRTEFDALMKQLQDSGGLLSDDQFNRIDKYGDEMSAMFERVKTAAVASATDVGKAMEKQFGGVMGTTGAGKIISQLGKFVDFEIKFSPLYKLMDSISKGTLMQDTIKASPLYKLFGWPNLGGGAGAGAAAGGKGSIPMNVGGIGGMMGMALEAMMATLPIGIAEAYAEKAKKEAALSFAPPTDELARIGGFIGGTGNSQVSILRNIERYVGRTAVAGEQTVRKLENL